MSGPAVISIGELLVEFVSHDKGCGLRRIAEYSGPYPSGAPAIFADQVARCGVRSSLFGAVGRDGFGASLMQRLTEDGVDTAGVRERGDLTTGVAFVSYSGDGTRQFIFHLTDTAADSVEFTAGDLPEGDLILHVSGASLGDPRLRAAIMTAVDAVAARVDPAAQHQRPGLSVSGPCRRRCRGSSDLRRGRDRRAQTRCGGGGGHRERRPA